MKEIRKTESIRLQERKNRIRAMLLTLKKLFPHVGMALRYESDWELLVAVMLSAQCTDKRVNMVTEKLFKKYRTILDYANADPAELERDIYSTGFYRNKVRNIIATAQVLLDTYEGVLPDTMEGMLALPGVGRKTANVVLGNAYGVVSGIAVDTHVRRFAIRFDLTDYIDPVNIERDLMRIVPRREWFNLTYRFIEYGREYCPARAHACDKHPLTLLYPEAGHLWPSSK